MTDKLNTTTLNNNDDNPITLIKYQWETEANACKKCQEMNGKYFGSLEEFEKARPHPHCKCKPNAIFSLEIQKDKKDKKDMDIIYDKNFNNNEISNFEKIKKINELNQKTNTLGAKIQSSINITEENINELNQKIHNPILYSTIQKEKITKERNHQIEIKINLTNLNTQLNNLKSKLKNINIKQNLRSINDETIKLLEATSVQQAGKYNTIMGGALYSTLNNMPESYELYRLSLGMPTFRYLENNTIKYSPIENIPDTKLQTAIKKRIALENINPNGIQVVEFHPNSSIVKAIKNSQNFKKFLATKQSEINIYGQIPDTKIEFTNIDPDMYAAFHGAELKNIHLDKNGNLHVRLEDIYNFNPGRTSVKGRIGRKLQENGTITPYYIICHIIVTKNEMLR